MADIEEVKSQINAANDDTDAAVSSGANAASQIEEAISRLQTATAGSNNPKVEETIAQLEAAKAAYEEGNAVASSAMESANEYAAIL